jgi:hypothetical protein
VEFAAGFEPATAGLEGKCYKRGNIQVMLRSNRASLLDFAPEESVSGLGNQRLGRECRNSRMVKLMR